MGNYDMFYDDENMADSDVSVVHHTDIYKDPIYKHPYNSGGYQTSTGIYVETLIDHLPPEIIIEISDQAPANSTPSLNYNIQLRK